MWKDAYQLELATWSASACCVCDFVVGGSGEWCRGEEKNEFVFQKNEID